MGKVTRIEPVQHVYEVDYCAGCGIEVKDDYTELGLPSGDGKEMKHIALCPSCGKEAKKNGVF